ncbi:MAG TPA: 5-(carboxyamino)imidazole ribonucleotide mutase [Candidatus Omnitrophota bacterium]|nr:5-(carboxyamino)imidazole ribonucleotide mutase [Candidatus Omnitrophota bacterium]HNQ50699.1 5-(carboxyamino)imidazole ribonucleotide mutase [Candidatus Omnitrophota bacterium]HQO37438.1 5-(carboxyamino)imidazole ribonucleotide mutase [Candidatus Omnitrophota bacterium]HQQ05685.1 5-(carboxyamino)imidazole ribonucleotide mutase [Candidatus Omnitrophota bacterium]
MARVAFLMGSQSDLETVRAGLDVLQEFKVGIDIRVLSAHRTPRELAAYVAAAEKQGVKVFIAAAGGSAALAGVIASHTALPVIGIPIETRPLKGIDSLLSTVQMPAGIPVACMAIGSAGARNAGLFAVEVLAVSDACLKRKLVQYRKKMRAKVLAVKLKV